MDAPNYPDILGYITNDTRLNITVVQAAMAVFPEELPSGHPFAVIVLLQSLVDVNATVTLTLNVPAPTASQRFGIQNPNLTITLRPGEVGYATMPIITLPDQDNEQSYKLRLDLDVKAPPKPRRVRQTDDKSAVNLNYYFDLSSEAIADMAELKNMTFYGQKRPGFTTMLSLGTRMLGAAFNIEASVKLTASKTGRRMTIKPSWISLWTLMENTDVRPLLERHQTTLGQFLNTLNVRRMVVPLLETVQKRIRAAGYNIHPAEAYFVVKVLLLILELGRRTKEGRPRPEEDLYRVALLLNKGWPDGIAPIQMPYWSRAYLYNIDAEQPTANDSVDAFTEVIFVDLMRDAVLMGFYLLHQYTEERLGDEEDMRAYVNHIAQALWNPDNKLTFVDVYVPLVLAGILLDERITLPGERKLDLLHQVMDAVRSFQEITDDDGRMVVTLTENIINAALQKYGYRL